MLSRSLFRGICRCRDVFSTSKKNFHAVYGGRFQVAAILGDGVGPEFVKHIRSVFSAINAPVDFDEVPLSGNTTDPNDLLNAILSVKRNGVGIKGNVETLDVPGFKSLNLELRTQLDLFACVVPCKNIPGIETRHSGVDIVCIRENTEGEYSSLEHESVPGVVESLKVITSEKSYRIAQFAFDYAVKNGRKKVTAVHKANIMKEGDGLFLRCCGEVAAKYPQIEFDDKIIDNMCMQLVKSPQQFDVLLLPNLYGNIVANVVAGLVGGSGVVAGCNFGKDYAVFEMGTRNTGAVMTGKNVANPSGILLASADLLEYLSLKSHAEMIRDAVFKTITTDKVRTADIGGSASTTEVVDNILHRIAAES